MLIKQTRPTNIQMFLNSRLSLKSFWNIIFNHCYLYLISFHIKLVSWLPGIWLISEVYLTHFFQSSFLVPLKTFGFLMFSRGPKGNNGKKWLGTIWKIYVGIFFFRNLQLKIIRVLNTPLSFQSTENQSKFNETWFRTDKRSIFWQQSEAAIGVAL